MHDSFKIRAIRKRYWLGAILAFALMASGLYYFPSHKPEVNENESFAAQMLKLPLFFEKNEGQTYENIKYLTRGTGYSFYFTPQEIVMVLQDENLSPSILKMSFIGANPKPTIEGIEEGKSRSNYFIGKDSQNWKTNIPHFAKIAYQELYSGIDAIFYGNGEEFEYDLCIAPGTNPQKARFHIDGADQLFTDVEGNLHIVAKGAQELLMHKPFVYQKIDEKLVTVSGEFVLLAQNQVGFSIGSYDMSKELVIDPVLAYSTFLGGSGHDSMRGVAVDNSGSVYVTGQTTSSNFPVTPGVAQPKLERGQYVLISKIDPSKGDKSSLIYSTYLGGHGNEYAGGIAVDVNGNIFVSGQTDSSDFPVTPGALKTILETGAKNAFVTKLNSTGSELIYSTYLGGSNVDWSNNLDIDSSGKAYVTGVSVSDDFPTTLNAFQPSKPSNAKVTSYISVLDESGSNLIYSTYLGAIGTLGEETEAYGYDIAIDREGFAYVTGLVVGSQFPTSVDAFKANFQGSGNAFVTKINPYANTGAESLIYSTLLGGASFDIGRAIAVDENGHAYLTGSTLSEDFPTTAGAFQASKPSPIGKSSAFITKLDPQGSGLIYSTFLGGNNHTNGHSIVINKWGAAHITGDSTASNFPITNQALQKTLGGELASNGYVAKLNPDGTSLKYSSYLGGSGQDIGYGIALNPLGHVFVVGQTNSDNFPITNNAFQTLTDGQSIVNGFVTKLTMGKPKKEPSSTKAGSKKTTTVLTISPNPVAVGQSTTLTATVTPCKAKGTVTFRTKKNKVLGTAILEDGVATLSQPPLKLGSHSITATYNGNCKYAKSTSKAVSLVVSKVLPPKNPLGTLIKNQFATQTDRINVLTWENPTEGNPPVIYLIYRNKELTDLIDTVSAKHRLIYIKHDRKKQPYTYFIVSVDQFGNKSKPAKIVVKPNQRQNVPLPPKKPGCGCTSEENISTSNVSSD